MIIEVFLLKPKYRIYKVFVILGISNIQCPSTIGKWLSLHFDNIRLQLVEAVLLQIVYHDLQTI